MTENKISKTKVGIYLVDTLLIVGTLVGLLMMFDYTRPLVIAPIDNHTTTDNSVLFSFRNANVILIDDDPLFGSAQEFSVRDDVVIKLTPGTYYWKVQGIQESEVRVLTIQDTIDLQIRAIGNETYEVRNAGNLPLNVDVYDNMTLVERITIRERNSANKTGDRFIGGYHEE